MNKTTDISSLPPELISSTLITLPFKDLLSACATNQSFRTICQSDGFWIQKLAHDFHIEADSSSAKEQYLQALSTVEAFRGCERYQNIQHCLLLAMRQLDDGLVDYFIQLGAKFEDLLVKSKNQLTKLKLADPEVFWPGAARLVQANVQPLVFDIQFLDVVIRYLYPQYIKNVLVYHNRLYVSPLTTDGIKNQYPYVYLKKSPEGKPDIPALFKERKHEIPDMVNIPELVMEGKISHDKK